MDVTGVGSTATQTTSYNKSSSKVANNNENTEKKTENNTTNQPTSNSDKEKGFLNDVKYTPDKDKVSSMIKEAEQKMSSFISMVEKLIMKQGQTFTNVFDAIRQGHVEVDEATRMQAEQEIGEDGYYGVEKTSQRIFDFAVAISGGDPSKIEKLKEAVDKGFKSAEKMWGGELPEISKKTYDAVMKKFDEWENESKKSVEASNVAGTV